MGPLKRRGPAGVLQRALPTREESGSPAQEEAAARRRTNAWIRESRSAGVTRERLPRSAAHPEMDPGPLVRPAGPVTRVESGSPAARSAAPRSEPNAESGNSRRGSRRRHFDSGLPVGSAPLNESGPAGVIGGPGDSRRVRIPSCSLSRAKSATERILRRTRAVAGRTPRQWPERSEARRFSRQASRLEKSQDPQHSFVLSGAAPAVLPNGGPPGVQPSARVRAGGRAPARRPAPTRTGSPGFPAEPCSEWLSLSAARCFVLSIPPAESRSGPNDGPQKVARPVGPDTRAARLGRAAGPRKRTGPSRRGPNPGWVSHSRSRDQASSATPP